MPTQTWMASSCSGLELRGRGVVDDQAVEAAEQLGAFGHRGCIEWRGARAADRRRQIESRQEVVGGRIARQDAAEVVAERHARHRDVLLGDQLAALGSAPVAR